MADLAKTRRRTSPSRATNSFMVPLSRADPTPPPDDDREELVPSSSLPYRVEPPSSSYHPDALRQ